MECYKAAEDRCNIFLILPPALLCSLLFFLLAFSPLSEMPSCQRREQTWRQSSLLFCPCSAFLIEFEGFFLLHALILCVMRVDWMQRRRSRSPAVQILNCTLKATKINCDREELMTVIPTPKYSL